MSQLAAYEHLLTILATYQKPQTTYVNVKDFIFTRKKIIITPQDIEQKTGGSSIERKPILIYE